MTHTENIYLDTFMYIRNIKIGITENILLLNLEIRTWLGQYLKVNN